MADPIVEPRAAAGGPAWLALGFRPFFLMAGLFAAVAIPVYLALLDGTIRSAGTPIFWHAHEMLFGYTAAVLSGFLLTAVPNWTGAPPVRNGRLLALVCLWLAGRIVMWLDGSVPATLVAAVDLLHLPAVALAVAPALMGVRNRRNYVFFILIGLLTLANGLMHAATAGWLETDWLRRGQFLALDIVLLMIALIGGRIIPAFTGNWLRQQRLAGEIAARPLLDRAALVAMAGLAVADLAAGDRSAITAALCLAAAALAAIRLAGWRGAQATGEPILVILHLGYGWLTLGLALRGLDILFAFLAGAGALHALTIGAIGTMTVAVMSRAALGHSGRPLRAGLLLMACYGLVSVAAVARMIGAQLPGVNPAQALLVSGGAWSMAFLAFLVALSPALLGHRRDGNSA